MFKENEKHSLLSTLYEYYYSIVTDTYEGLEKALINIKPINLEICMKFPIVLRRDLEHQLASVYTKYGYYEKALNSWNKLRNTFKEINCLISLKNNEEAVFLIKSQLDKLKECDTFNKKILYCDYSVKLGWILEDPTWFDKGYYIYRRFEPLEHKARYYFKKEDFLNSKLAYEETLKIVPQNEKILYAYASVKIKLGEYLECKDLFLKLLEMDKRNADYARNLALCYYHEEELESCMKILKKNALGDASSMEFYFKLAIKNKRKEEILWCISRISEFRYIEYFIKYFVTEKIISLEEAIESKNKNPHIKDIKLN